MGFKKIYGRRLRLTPQEEQHIYRLRKQQAVASEISPPKILVFDIETAPLRAFVWSIWQNGVNLNAVDGEWFMLSWAAKWLFDNETMSDVLTPNEVIEEQDNRIVKTLWRLFDEADIVIAHNGDKFDIKKSNTRFLMNDLFPPSPYQSIDTLKVLKDKFSFTSNKMDYVNKLLGLRQKNNGEGQLLWNKCMNGDGKALAKMKEYNENDVNILEELYVVLRPWIKSHPNLGLYVDTNMPVCPACMSEDLNVKGSYRTAVSSYVAFQCNNCKAVGRFRNNVADRSNLTVSLAR